MKGSRKKCHYDTMISQKIIQHENDISKYDFVDTKMKKIGKTDLSSIVIPVKLICNNISAIYKNILYVVIN